MWAHVSFQISNGDNRREKLLWISMSREDVNEVKDEGKHDRWNSKGHSPWKTEHPVVEIVRAESYWTLKKINL